jgi:hypothetical protein
MDKHALAVLELAQSWSWPSTLKIQQSGAKSKHGKFKDVTRKLLAGLISEIDFGS